MSATERQVASRSLQTAATGSVRKVRVCIVLGGHFEAQMGGAQYQAKCLLDALAEHSEFETYYLAQVVPANRKRPSYTIVQFGSTEPKGATDVIKSLPSLYRALRELKPDVIYQRCLMPYTGACAYYAARHGAKFVFHVASDDDVKHPRGPNHALGSMPRRLARMIGEYGMRRANARIAQTSEQARLLEAEYGLDVTAVVPNFQPPPGAPPPPRDVSKLRVAWIGNFKALKRPELFVGLAEAFASKPDIEFVMIGRPGDEQFSGLRKRMQQLPNLRYLGELPVERVNDELAASDLLVTTSTYEGFPNTFIQGWLRGVPALSCSVNPEGCLTSGGAGRLVKDMSEMRDVVLELKNDRAKLAALSQQALDYGRANHLPEKARVLVDLLRDLGSR